MLKALFKDLLSKTNGKYESYNIKKPQNLHQLMTPNDWSIVSHGNKTMLELI